MYSDSFLLDWLDAKTAKGTKVICRDSTTGRGWRLHQTSEHPKAKRDVREAILAAIAAERVALGGVL